MELHLRNPFSPHGLNNTRFSAGFTFIETMIVFLLLGIVTMVAWPTLNGAMNDSRLSGAAEEVVTALEFAQMTAMSSGRQTRVVIGAPADRIAVRRYESPADLFGGGDVLVDTDVETGTYEFMGNPMNKGTDYEIIFPNVSRFQGVDITASDFNVGDPVFFDTLGNPSKGGSATLALGSRQVVVNLDSLTGKVTLSD